MNWSNYFYGIFVLVFNIYGFAFGSWSMCVCVLSVGAVCVRAREDGNWKERAEARRIDVKEYKNMANISLLHL